MNKEVLEDTKEKVIFTEKNEILLKCYICKKSYSIIHHFYDQLCPSCAKLNFYKRNQKGDLKGKVALVTGART